MTRIAAVITVCSLAVAGFSVSSFAKDNADVDVFDLCNAANQLCHATCAAKYPGTGFSDQLGRGLCEDDCVAQFRICVNTGDDAMARGAAETGGISKLKRQSLPKIAY